MAERAQERRVSAGQQKKGAAPASGSPQTLNPPCTPAAVASSAEHVAGQVASPQPASCSAGEEGGDGMGAHVAVGGAAKEGGRLRWRPQLQWQ